MHELTGPNKKNWDFIFGNVLSTDYDCKLLREVFKLLGHSDLSTNSAAVVLYSNLRLPTALAALNMIFSTGYLKAAAIKEASVAGAGSPQWLAVVGDMKNLAVTIAILQRSYIDCQMNPQIPIELLCIRAESLLKVSADDAEDLRLTYWICCSEADKSKVTISATQLCGHIAAVKSVHEGAIAAASEQATLKAEKEALSLEQARLAKQRAHNGAAFLNDPSRDSDFLNTPVVPTPVELLSPPPLLLPKNLVSLTTRAQSSKVDDENQELDETETSLKQSDLDNSGRYRNAHHYLNTHFQLNREDCLAQLRRGIHEFRSLMGATSDDEIRPPTIELIRRSAKQ